MPGRLFLVALTAVISVVILKGGVTSRHLLEVAIGIAGLGLAGMMFIWSKPPSQE